MFESTVIQFGTDQMIEAQLSTFIHWYCLYIVNVCIDTTITGIVVYLSYCQIKSTDSRDLAIIKLVILCHAMLFVLYYITTVVFEEIQKLAQH